MNRSEFRIVHSTLIEHYQYIEHHLEGIYAAISGKPLVYGLEDVEESTIGNIVCEIKKIETKQNVSIIPNEVYDRLENARLKRNFWCHNCYVDMLFKLNGDPKKDADIKMLSTDLREAEDLREVLYQIKIPLITGNRSEF